MTGLFIAFVNPEQTAAEYVGIAGREVVGKVRGMAGQVSHWVDTQPGLIWGVAALMLLLLWFTRRR